MCLLFHLGSAPINARLCERLWQEHSTYPCSCSLSLGAVCSISALQHSLWRQRPLLRCKPGRIATRSIGRIMQRSCKVPRWSCYRFVLEGRVSVASVMVVPEHTRNYPNSTKLKACTQERKHETEAKDDCCVEVSRDTVLVV